MKPLNQFPDNTLVNVLYSRCSSTKNANGWNMQGPLHSFPLNAFSRTEQDSLHSSYMGTLYDNSFLRPGIIARIGL